MKGTLTERLQAGIPSGGIYAGATAWMLSTLANYALVPWICAHQIRLVPAVAIALALVSLAGGLLSWRAFRAPSAGTRLDESAAGRPHRFVAIMGMAASALFTVTILVQGAAGIVFHGCER